MNRSREGARLPAPSQTRNVLFVSSAGRIETPVYTRDAFVPGLHAHGPMIIDQMDCTTVVPPNWSVSVDGYRNLHLTREGGEHNA